MNIKKIILMAMVLVFFVSNKDAVAITTTYCAIPKSPTQVISQVAAKNNFKHVNFLIKLAEAESGLGNKTEILDVNGLYSRGLYHMQQAFWQDNCAHLFGDSADIFSFEQQTECVINVVRTRGVEYVASEGGWYNSCKRINCNKLLNS